MIPKVVHRIWFGPYRMRRELVEFGRSWEKHGYDVQLWTEKNLPELRNRATYDALEREGVNVGGGIPETGLWVQRADIASYELIWRYGGIYANTDMECLRPLDPILEGVDAFAGYEQSDFVGNALMGATPNHPFFDAVIDELPLRRAANGGQPMSIQTGPYLMTHVRVDIHPGLTVFPQEVFYPYSYAEMDREWDDHPDAFTSHHWGHQRGHTSEERR